MGQVYGLNLFPDEDAYQIYDPPYDRAHDNYAFEIQVFVELNKLSIDMPDEVCGAYIQDWIKFFKTGKADLDALDYIKEASKIIKYENLT